MMSSFFAAYRGYVKTGGRTVIKVGEMSKQSPNTTDPSRIRL